MNRTRNLHGVRRAVQGGPPFQGFDAPPPAPPPAPSLSSPPSSPPPLPTGEGEVGDGGSGDWVTLATELTKAGISVTSAAVEASQKKKPGRKRQPNPVSVPAPSPAPISPGYSSWLYPVGGGALLLVLIGGFFYLRKVRKREDDAGKA